MKSFIVNQIGIIKNERGRFRVELDKKYIPALKTLEKFGHVNVFWWADTHDNEIDRSNLTEESPYKNAPDTIGTFATRSPMRPNPIAMSVCHLDDIDFESGVINLSYIDAENDTPVLDIKPYHPSSDRVDEPTLPDWFATFPKSLEESADFDWSTVFNF